MGDEEDDILTAFKPTDEERTNYDSVKEKFTSYFVKRQNVIYERAKFNRRKEEEGESLMEFILDLNHLAEHCGFGPLHQELIRDRIVVGLRDSKLSEKLQLDADLTLEKAVTAARQTEDVKKQQAALRSDFQDNGKQSKQVDGVRGRGKMRSSKQDLQSKKPKSAQEHLHI